jgi:hypothetical protein
MKVSRSRGNIWVSEGERVRGRWWEHRLFIDNDHGEVRSSLLYFSGWESCCALCDRAAIGKGSPKMDKLNKCGGRCMRGIRGSCLREVDPECC